MSNFCYISLAVAIFGEGRRIIPSYVSARALHLAIEDLVESHHSEHTPSYGVRFCFAKHMKEMAACWWYLFENIETNHESGKLNTNLVRVAQLVNERTKKKSIDFEAQQRKESRQRRQIRMPAIATNQSPINRFSKIFRKCRCRFWQVYIIRRRACGRASQPSSP